VAEGLEPKRTTAGVPPLTGAMLAGIEFGELVERTRAALSADSVALLMLDEERGELRVQAARGFDEAGEVAVPLGRWVAGRAAAEGHAVVVDDAGPEDMSARGRARGIRSLAGAPLVVDGRVAGVFAAGACVPNAFGGTQMELLRLAAERAGLAVERARLRERERRMAETLQRSLLPAQLVELPGVEVAARYVPPVAKEVGGDWYDAFTLPDGRLGVAIGEVAGRGLRAAALMGRLRSALRAYALEGRGAAETAELMNRVVRDAEPGVTATMLYLTYAPDTGRAEVVNAGHLPPVVAATDGSAGFLEVACAAPLGADRHGYYAIDEVALVPGSTLLLYTDGLVAAADADRLRAAAECAPAGAAELADAVLAGLAADGASSADDVALLALRPLPLADELHERFTAEPESVPVMRRLLSRWLRERGVPADTAYDSLVACAEAAANAVEHAYGTATGATFEVEAAMRGADLELAVTDRGGWREPRGQSRGRGLMLMEAFMDAVELRTTATGTTVVMRRRVPELQG
jgi:anti-sigma regulatory factor (Ser/Thr protein kinase)